MKQYFYPALRTLIATCFCLPILFVTADTPEPLSTPELISALQSGGHIMYMRHGETDVTQKDDHLETFKNCKNQRNLTKQGREKLKSIGGIIHDLKIPIGKVLSSPYCRTKESAELTFGEFTVESNLQFSISKSKEEAARLGKQLYFMMLNTEESTDNQVFVGHTANLKDGLGVWPKPEGVIAIFKKHDGELIFKGMIKPDEWKESLELQLSEK
ncbi:histidine phosphatase family protein [Leucothrix mucor]|uniref:histidine phosphatase family protein n=1 Tax=Leucothrix mucor TaxID=45248 RepID=UPI0012F883EA|nr:histidine phosphatase family protein [Leucothrix mucor]